MDDSIKKIERYRNSPKTGICSLEYISQRYIYGIQCQHDFYKTNIQDYEKDITLLRNHLLSLNLDQVYSYNIGTSIAKEDFIRHDLRASEIFIFSEFKIDNLPVKKIESSMYATIYASSYDEEIEDIKKLIRYTEENHYSLSGDYLCEVLTEFNVFDQNERGMFLRLQVPVKFNS